MAFLANRTHPEGTSYLRVREKVHRRYNIIIVILCIVYIVTYTLTLNTPPSYSFGDRPILISPSWEVHVDRLQLSTPKYYSNLTDSFRHTFRAQKHTNYNMIVYRIPTRYLVCVQL